MKKEKFTQEQLFLLGLLRQKSFTDMEAMDHPPTLSVLVDNTADVVKYPEKYMPKYLELLEKDLDLAQEFISKMRAVLMHQKFGIREPTLMAMVKGTKSRKPNVEEGVNKKMRAAAKHLKSMIKKGKKR